MKRIVSQIWKDISRGKNIIDYVLILAAVVLPLLNIFKLVSTEWIITLTLPTLGLLVTKAVTNTWRAEGDVRIYETWTDEVYDALAKAKDSVVVVTSWVIDATVLADKINAACKNINSDLKLHIYMLDPAKPFGAQRYGEVYDPDKDHESTWPMEYRNHFDAAVKQLKHRLLKTRNLELNLYIYHSLPNVKICVVDNETFFFGWLPAGQASTESVCFQLSDKSTNAEVQCAILRLKKHLAALKDQSTLQFSTVRTTTKTLPVSHVSAEPQPE